MINKLIQTAALANSPRPRRVRICPTTMPSQHHIATATEKQIPPWPAAICATPCPFDLSLLEKSELQLLQATATQAERFVQLDQADVENQLNRLQERTKVAHPGAEEAPAEVTESPDRVADRVEVEELVLSAGVVG